jgi:SAM-dependent methyltransferase
VSGFREAVWAGVAPDALPEAFAPRRAWLLARIPPHARVLDLGCGDGAFAAELVAAGAEVLGVDVAAAAIERARARAPGAEFRLVAEGEPLPVANGWADVVWAGEVLEHVVDVPGTLADVRLALKPGGILLATTPAHGPLLTRTSNLSPSSDHLRFFTRKSLYALLTDQFLNVTIRRRRGRLHACAS